VRKIGIAIGLVSALSFPALGDDQGLEGTYKLVSSSRQILETGKIVDTFGKHPAGYMNYGRDGRMLVLIVADKDDRPAPVSAGAMTDEQRANLFRTMVAYGGTYKYDGHTIEHHLDISWNQAWTGTTQVRDIQKEGDKLIYKTRPAPFFDDGKMSVVTLVWQKVQ
jgi:hypothetical protein